MITTLADIDLRPLNTFGIAARADSWTEFTSRDDIPAVASILASAPGGGHVVGACSNILFTSARITAPLAHSAILTHSAEPLGGGRVRVYAGSGITMDSLIERTCRSGLTGLECLSLIPGEAGASAVQNVGAYGAEAADVIESVDAYDTRLGRFVALPASACRFAYRSSLFKSPEERGRYIIAGVSFILSSTEAPRIAYAALADALADTPAPTAADVRSAVIAIRRAKLPDPTEAGSAGSYFTNPVVTPEVYAAISARASEMAGSPVEPPRYPLPDGRIKVPAAWLIDRAGLRGASSGGAALWPTQPLVITNISGHATADDVIALERHVVSTVASTFGVTLTPEVEKIS